MSKKDFAAMTTSKNIWTPTAKQSVMLSSVASYILFGGSRGGG